MALNSNQVKKVRSALHRGHTSAGLAIPWTKPDVDTAIGDADTWQNSNKASFNSALSQPFKGSASAADKAVLLASVIFAEHLVANPSHVQVIRSIVNQLEGIHEVV
jgi:hypothetical protein